MTMMTDFTRSFGRRGSGGRYALFLLHFGEINLSVDGTQSMTTTSAYATTTTTSTTAYATTTTSTTAYATTTTSTNATMVYGRDRRDSIRLSITVTGARIGGY